MRSACLPLLTMTFMLAACGGNEQTSTTSAAPAASTPAPATGTPSSTASAAVTTSVAPPSGVPSTPPPPVPSPSGLAINPLGGAVKIDVPNRGPASGPNTIRPEVARLEQELARLPRLTPEGLKPRVDSGKAIVVDVRNAMAYPKGHITGSRNMPLSQFPMLLANLPRDKEIVTYCT